VSRSWLTASPQLQKSFLYRHSDDLSYQSQQKTDVKGTPQGTSNPQASWREREHDGAVFREAKGDVPRHLHEIVLEAPRGRDGAANRYEGVARQVREEGRIGLLEGFVRQFLGITGINGKASRRQVGSWGPCMVHCIPSGYAGIRFSVCLSITTRRRGWELLRELASGGDLSAKGEMLCTILQMVFAEFTFHALG
jgi:hypothetical protein